MKNWAQHNRCDADYVETRISPEVRKRAWQHCQAATEIYLVDNGGHAWPGKPQPAFEKSFGPTINKLIDTGAIAADYYMVAILNSSVNDQYSTRAANAGYCVAGTDTSATKDAFRRFHTALFAQQPAEGSPAPDNKALIETARQAGVVGTVPDCVNGGKNNELVEGLASAAKINATPTVRINGEDYKYTTPDALVAKVKEIVGDVPGLDGAVAPAA